MRNGTYRTTFLNPKPISLGLKYSSTQATQSLIKMNKILLYIIYQQKKSENLCPTLLDVQKYNRLLPSSFGKSTLQPSECCECEYASLLKKVVGTCQNGFSKHAPGTIFRTLRSTGQHCTHMNSRCLMAETMKHVLAKLKKSD